MAPDPGWNAVLDSARADATVRTVRDLVRLCETVISRADLSCVNSMGSPRADAEALVYETLAIRDDPGRYAGAALTPVERDTILDLLERRVAGRVPVPYLTGEAVFDGLRFAVRPGVFVPRNAIHHLIGDIVEAATWSEPPRVLELGCGVGAIGIAIAVRVPDARVDLIDVDPLAVAVTDENIGRHRLRDRVRVSASDMFAAVDPTVRYDLVVANLPYVPADHSPRGGNEIDVEPVSAIFRPGDGLDLVRVALDETVLHLAESGTLVLEVGTENVHPVRSMLGVRGRWAVTGGRDVGVVSLTRDDLKG